MTPNEVDKIPTRTGFWAVCPNCGSGNISGMGNVPDSTGKKWIITECEDCNTSSKRPV